VEQNSTNINRRNEEDKLMYPFMLVKQGIILFIILVNQQSEALKGELLYKSRSLLKNTPTDT